MVGIEFEIVVDVVNLFCVFKFVCFSLFVCFGLVCDLVCKGVCIGCLFYLFILVGCIFDYYNLGVREDC